MPSILCVGDEAALNRSRAAVLRTLGCHVAEEESSAATRRLNTLAYDMVVLCHTVPLDAASAITAHASILARQPRVVRIDSPFGASAPPADGVLHIDPALGPGVLVESVRRAFDLPALARNPAAAKAPAHSVPALPVGAQRQAPASLSRPVHH